MKCTRINAAVKIVNIEDVVKKEKKRFDSHVGSFVETNSPYLKDVEGLVNFAREKEDEIF